jgi:hypothetical protein
MNDARVTPARLRWCKGQAARVDGLFVEQRRRAGARRSCLVNLGPVRPVAWMTFEATGRRRRAAASLNPRVGGPVRRSKLEGERSLAGAVGRRGADAVAAHISGASAGDDGARPGRSGSGTRRRTRPRLGFDPAPTAGRTSRRGAGGGSRRGDRAGVVTLLVGDRHVSKPVEVVDLAAQRDARRAVRAAPTTLLTGINAARQAGRANRGRSATTIDTSPRPPPSPPPPSQPAG